jgi:hypothetical protein
MHDIGCEHVDVWSCSGNTYLLTLADASPRRAAPDRRAGGRLRAARR